MTGVKTFTTCFRIAPVVILFLTIITVAGAMAGWLYKRPITISYSGTAELFDQQVVIDLDDDPPFSFDYGHARTNGEDVRFSTDGTGDSLPDLDHYIAYWNFFSGMSKIIVKVPTIPATGDTTIYMFYGNDYAENTSDGDVVFEFFDDFESGNLDKWQVLTDWGTWSIATDWKSDGQYSMKGQTPGTGGADMAAIACKACNFHDCYYTAVIMVNRPGSPSRASMAFRIQDVDNYYMYRSYASGSPRERGGVWKRVGGASPSLIQDGNGNRTFTKDQFQSWEMGVADTNFIAYLENTEILDTGIGSTFSNGKVGVVFWADPSSPQTVWVDQVTVSKWVIPEPEPSVGDEENGDFSLPVELSFFTAAVVDGSVLLCWRTEVEVDNLGFHVYRSERWEGPFARVNEAIIPGAGSSTLPCEYEFVDRTVRGGHRYFYYIEDMDTSGDRGRSEMLEISVPEGTSGLPGISPERSFLDQNIPNPFNPQTTIEYRLSRDTDVRLVVFDLSGRMVKRLVDEPRAAGYHSTHWDGRDDAGREVGSGIYVYRLQIEEFVSTRKMVLLR